MWRLAPPAVGYLRGAPNGAQAKESPVNLLYVLLVILVIAAIIYFLRRA